ncbi:MAG: phenylacetate--CoA ligase family protein [Candidatus Riflebacteria bacterium]|nr:phenylacetate--CoA ligase family protein [Candidatus Riflebacteria bacterium]
MTDALPYETLRERHARTVAELLPGLLAALDLPRADVLRLQVKRLRELVAWAKEASPFHRRRLAAVDAASLTIEELPRLPIMTRSDMMASYDEILTDRRLTLDLVNSHLAGLREDAYLLDHHHAVMSSGSSGLRGVFVYDWEGWAICYCGYLRNLLRARRREKRFYDDESGGILGAMNAAHSSTALFQTFSKRARHVIFSVTSSLAEIVDGLNRAQPTVLQGYPSALHLLALEAREGRLCIAPKDLCVGAEPLLPEIRATLEATWPVPIWNAWGTSEAGALALSCGYAPGMHLSEDLVIVEPVDDQDRPVGPGTRSSAVLVTNLYNRVLPLIRCKITDEVVVVEEECPCGSKLRRIADIQGRSEEWFRYGDVSVHPVLFRDPLGMAPNVVEYQVVQTVPGASIRIRTGGPVDLPSLRDAIAASLRKAGVPEPEVDVASVAQLPRSRTGKIQRFVPLGRQGSQDS